MKKWLLLGVFMSILGCQEVQLRNDGALPAARSNYPTVEMTACGQRFHGLGFCEIQANENPNKIDLSVQTYFLGIQP